MRLVDIAREVGFSVAVVSRALNPSPDPHAVIATGTRQKIEAAAARLGYRRNRAAEFLARGKSAAIGIFLPDVADRLIADMMIGLSEAAAAKSFPLNFYFGLGEEGYRDFFRQAERNAHSGLITYPHSFISKRSVRTQIKRYLQKGGTLVFIKPYNFEFTLSGAVTVGVDDAFGGALAAERLLKLGCARFVKCAESGDLPQSPRTQGFLEALHKANRDGDLADEAALRRILKSRRAFTVLRPLGIFADSDKIALRLFKLIGETPYVLGREVKLIGYDDQSFAADLPVPLTTVRQPFRELGRLALEKTVALLYGRAVSNEMLKPALVLRQSA